jgi:hypothetical protein
MANAMAGSAAPAAAPAGPPPLPNQGPLFHVEAGGQAGGPFSVAQLQAEVAAGRLTGNTLVWTAGMAQWSPANTVPALAPLFNVPPPLPPGAGAPPAPPAAS